MLLKILKNVLDTIFIFPKMKRMKIKINSASTKLKTMDGEVTYDRTDTQNGTQGLCSFLFFYFFLFFWKILYCCAVQARTCSTLIPNLHYYLTLLYFTTVYLQDGMK